MKHPVCEHYVPHGGQWVQSLTSIAANYNNIQSLWEVAVSSVSNTEMKARIQGVQSQMKTFKFLFNLILSELILQHTDKLSQTLQQPQLSSVEGHGVAMLTVKTIGHLQMEDNFELLWKKAEMMRNQFYVDEPNLGRRKKVPKRLD